MAPAILWHRFRQMIGRALRETGQTIDRCSIIVMQHAVTTREFGDDPYIFDDHLSRHRHQMPLLERGTPLVSPHVAFLAPCSTLIGTVHVASDASIWYKAILRADENENGSSFAIEPKPNPENDDELMETFNLEDERFIYQDRGDNTMIGGGIFIGPGTNVQDNAVITSRWQHCQVGKGVTIGHSAQLHSCTVKDYSLIGMGSVLNKGVVVESESFIAAGAIVAEHTTIPSGELWVGNPARKLRDLTQEERTKLHYQSEEYINVAKTQAHVAELGGNLQQMPSLTGTEQAPQEQIAEHATPNDDDDDDVTRATKEEEKVVVADASPAESEQQQQPVGVKQRQAA